ncbi:MAG: hypothetical protein J6L89_05355 [Clostridia bacterium]|nr:hypothetical protein [Clostridia bacterium]
MLSAIQKAKQLKKTE